MEQPGKKMKKKSRRKKSTSSPGVGDDERESEAEIIRLRMFAESERYKSVQKVAAEFEKICNKPYLKSKKWYKHWESWLWDARTCSVDNSDFVLPDNPECTRNESLCRKLELAGADHTNAVMVCEKLGNISRKESTLLSNKVSLHQKDASMRRLIPDLQSFHCELNDDKVIMSFNDTCVDINRWHFDKLSCMYKDSKWFKENVFVLLARYYSVQGAQPQGGGNQAAVPSRTMELLETCLDVHTECFASPLNCYVVNGQNESIESHSSASLKRKRDVHVAPLSSTFRFCSLFYDTDRYFGSRGKFDNLNLSRGSFQANPPYEAASVRRMSAHMHLLLDAASRANEALQFIVIIPHWGTDGAKEASIGGHDLDRENGARREAWLSLSSSVFLSRRLQLPMMKHSFMEGCQHVKSVGKYRPSCIDTDIFFLQTRGAVARWPLTDSFIDAVRLSFDPSIPSHQFHEAVGSAKASIFELAPTSACANHDSAGVSSSVSAKRRKRKKAFQNHKKLCNID